MSIDRSLSQYRLGLLVLDALALSVAFFLAHGIRHGSLGSIPGPYLQALPYTLVVLLGSLRFLRSYDSVRGSWFEVRRIVAGLASGMAVILSLGFFYRGFSYSRLTALLFPAIAFMIIVLGRFAYRAVLLALFGKSRWLKRVLIVGSSQTAMSLLEELRVSRSDYIPIGIVSGTRPEDSEADLSTAADVTFYDAAESIGGILDRSRPDLVIVCDSILTGDEQSEIVHACYERDIHWKVVPRVIAPPGQDIGLTVVAGIPLLGSLGNNITGFNYWLKRGLDNLIAMALLLAFSPLLLFVAIMIKVCSPGPVLFVQERVGFRGRRFRFFKFRSMHVSNDEKVHREYVQKWINGAEDEQTDGDGTTVHKLTDDPRIIPFIGKFIRKYSIDELPQLFNVIRGDMSLVGPRPCLPYEAELYERRHRMRFDVLPGITGLWQVSGRNRLTFDEMVALDIRYLQHWSLSRDLGIMVRTPYAILFDKAY